MSNFKKHSGSCYTVYNQNGFNNSLYDYFQYTDKKEIREMVQNYPLKYPSTIIIIDQTFSCNRIYIETIENEFVMKYDIQNIIDMFTGEKLSKLQNQFYKLYGENSKDMANSCCVGIGKASELIVKELEKLL